MTSNNGQHEHTTPLQRAYQKVAQLGASLNVMDLQLQEANLRIQELEAELLVLRGKPSPDVEHLVEAAQSSSD